MRIFNQSNNELTITGNIKSVDDSAEIKNALNAIKQSGAKSIVIKIEDSFMITSTIIGYLIKMISSDEIHISLLVGDPRLYQLLDEMCLISMFGVETYAK